MPAKFLLETLRAADGGNVECVIETQLGHVKGVIRSTFFEEFTGGTLQKATQLSPTQCRRILGDNTEWLQSEAERQINLGMAEIVIR